MTTPDDGRRAAPGTGAPVSAEAGGRMTKRQTLEALSGMLLAMFTAFLSSTIVSNALPTIITDLHGTQSQYTWVVTATLLASTASTPIWGKLADLISKKLLVQLAILIFTTGSVLAGLSQSVDTLIGWRALQGLGLGGLQSLVIIVIAAMISPRERGRYSGPIAAVMSIAPVVGPLIGGVIVDSSLGWRWCFFVGAPLAVVSLLVVQRTLNLPLIKRPVRIDYAGAALIAGGVCALLIWVTLAGNQFAWGSITSLVLAGLGVVLLAGALLVEATVREPIIPLRLFRDRTTMLATIASIPVGVAMFGGAVFLGQYFQIARGYSPTTAGLLTIPMIVGSVLSSTSSGALITRFGRWKAYLVAGAILMLGGFGALSTIDHETDLVRLAGYLFVLGTGMGMAMQNLVLAVQNSVAATDLGAASSTVAFFRSMGGTVGVSVLGAVLATRVSELTAQGLAAVGAPSAGVATGEVGIGSLNELPQEIAVIVRAAYGDATARIFLVAVALSVVSFVAVLFIKEVPLRTQSGLEQQQAEARRAADGTTPQERPARPVAADARTPVAAPLSDGHVAGPISGIGPVAGPPVGAGGRHAAVEPVAEPTPPALLAGPQLHGSVLSGDGTALAGAVVTVTDPAGRQEARATTAGDGTYAIAVSTGGTFLVVAAAGAFEPHAALVAVADRPVRHDIVLAATSGVHGRAHRIEGGVSVGVPGATVTLIDVTGNVAGAGVTDVDGRYRLPGVLDGTYTLTAAAPGLAPVAVSVVLAAGASAERDLELPSRAVLRGTVRAASTGAGVADALATLVDARGTVVGSAVTDPDGGFVFDDLPEGSYTLTARGYAPVAQEVQVSPGGVSSTVLRLHAAGGGHLQLGPPAVADGGAVR